jgi:hypothetical protein
VGGSKIFPLLWPDEEMSYGVRLIMAYGVLFGYGKDNLKMRQDTEMKRPGVW